MNQFHLKNSAIPSTGAISAGQKPRKAPDG